MKIEDYALIGDLRTSALVGRNGSIDWLCLPYTDSPACFAALLGDEQNGRWLLCPSAPVHRVSRRYREGTLILETEFETDTGTARVTDFMPLRDGGEPQIVRIVEGLQGEVEMHRRRARSSPLRRHRCRKTWAASVTGTTATAGCATRFSRSTRCSRVVMSTRRSRSGAGRFARPQETSPSYRSCTAPRANASSRRLSSTGSPDTKAQDR